MLPSDRPRYSAASPRPPPTPAGGAEQRSPPAPGAAGGGRPAAMSSATRPIAWAPADDREPAGPACGEAAGEVAGAEGQAAEDARGDPGRLHRAMLAQAAGLCQRRFPADPRPTWHRSGADCRAMRAGNSRDRLDTAARTGTVRQSSDASRAAGPARRGVVRAARGARGRRASLTRAPTPSDPPRHGAGPAVRAGARGQALRRRRGGRRHRPRDRATASSSRCSARPARARRRRCA